MPIERRETDITVSKTMSSGKKGFVECAALAPDSGGREEKRWACSWAE